MAIESNSNRSCKHRLTNIERREIAACLRIWYWLSTQMSYACLCCRQPFRIHITPTLLVHILTYSAWSIEHRGQTWPFSLMRSCVGCVSKTKLTTVQIRAV